MKQKEKHKEEQGSSILKTKNNTENEKKTKTPKSWFFKMIYKIDKPPPKLDRRWEDTNYQYQK